MEANVTEMENSAIVKTCYASVPPKRGKGARRASLVKLLIGALLVVIYSFLYRDEYNYTRVYHIKDGSTTGEYFTRKEILTFPFLYSIVLSFIGVVLGTSIDRLLLVAEEYKHTKERYDGSRIKMVKACFSGIHWKPVLLLVILTALFVICLTLFRVSAGKPWFELKYLAYVIGGIGVGPLVEYLLNLNTQSDVFMSTILEENQTYVANGIAWQYFIYLKQALPVFKNAARFLNLSKNKLILLIPLDCHTEDDLSKVDNKIVKVRETGRHGDAFRFKLYDLSVGNKKRRFAIQYVKEPLNTLKEMCLMKDCQAVTLDNLNEQVKLFQRTLFDIFNHQLRKVFKEACLFVSFDCEELEFLKNGGLAKVIIDGVENSHDEGDKIDGVPGFFKLERPKQSDNGGKTSKKKKSDSDVLISSSKNKTTLRNRQNSHLSEIVIVSDLDGGDVGQSTKHGVENSDV